MTYETISDYLHATPFVPFTVHLTDGRTYVVDHPDFTLWSRDRQNLGIVEGAARLSFFGLNSITQIEIYPAAMPRE